MGYLSFQIVRMPITRSRPQYPQRLQRIFCILFKVNGQSACSNSLANISDATIFNLVYISITGLCTTMPEFVETITVGKLGSEDIVFDVYTVGENHLIDFKLISGQDTTDLFEPFYSERNYHALKFSLATMNDSVKIKSNFDFGSRSIVVNNKVYQLTEKSDPYKNMSATFHSRGLGLIPYSMLYNDTISRLSSVEITIHKKVWDLPEVKLMADEFDNKSGPKLYTQIISYPSETLDLYVVRIAQVHNEYFSTISVYQYDPELDKAFRLQR